MKKFFLLFITVSMFLAAVAQKEIKPVTAAIPIDVQAGILNNNTNVNNSDSSGIVRSKQKQSIPLISNGRKVTAVKNQARTNTCWCFSATSVIESQCMKKNLGEFDISEMFTVRNVYFEKAGNYILRQGHTQFSEGGLGHDVIRAISAYGALPEDTYSGLQPGAETPDHTGLVVSLKKYLDSILKITPVPANWSKGYQHILDSVLGVPPAEFEYGGKKYTPKSFATEVLKFNKDEYVNITSFTHHPYYEPFIIEVPDNFSNGAYYNLPLNEMIQLTKDALAAGYPVLWDGDVSNAGFKQQLGVAYQFDSGYQVKSKNEFITGNIEEMKWDAVKRQRLYENLTTQDDHLMHITGMEKKANGKTFFMIKNSWGDIGPLHGFINVSEAYFAINTISIIVPKAVLSKMLLEKLKIK